MRDDPTPGTVFILAPFRGSTFWLGVIWVWRRGVVCVWWGWWFELGWLREGGWGWFSGERRASGNAAPWDQRERYLPDTFCRRFFTLTGSLAFKGVPEEEENG